MSETKQVIGEGTEDTPTPTSRPENVIENKTYRFTGNLFTLNVAHLAYLMNMMGIGITTGMYANLPADMKSHFTYVGDEVKDAGQVSES